MSNCKICPRNCNVDRSKKIGFCKNKNDIKIALASIHMWEEPCISNVSGSGTIFFSGCNLKCVYCQNYNISNKNFGKIITIKRLSEIMTELQDRGVHNINLVTPTHFVPNIIESIKLARRDGLIIPIIYNSSAYENIETITLLNGLIDVYLPDLKYYEDKYSIKYSNASNYFECATKVIDEMYKQVGKIKFDDNGLIIKGMIVRHLIIPGLIDDSKKILKYLYDKYKDNIYISIMNQYTPINLDNYPEINRKLTKEEYDDVINYCIELGIKNAYVQDDDTVSESFIPNFNLDGVEKI